MTPKEALKQYERATNSHRFDLVKPLVSDEAIYFFTDGSFRGGEEIKRSFEETWSQIKDERYRLDEVEWLFQDEKIAICIYRFHWRGIVRGKEKEGSGRGTNVFKKFESGWKVIHEHLSSLPE